MAEHMLILGIENPQGEVKYIAAAFRRRAKNQSGNAYPPEVYRKKGYKAWCVGDDIAWSGLARTGACGR